MIITGINMRDLAQQLKELIDRIPEQVTKDVTVLEHIDCPDEKFQDKTGYAAIERILAYVPDAEWKKTKATKHVHTIMKQFLEEVA